MRRPVRTTLVAVAAALSVMVPVTAPAGAQSDPPDVPPTEDHLRAFSIVPPGQEGDVTAAELASGNYGPHYDDQLQTYADLINDDDVTEEELPTYFHSMQFGPGEDIEDTYSPTDGVTVYRDSLGIPHIYADSQDLASFALGYVTAEDRLWESDVFRHAARGTLSEFIGPDFLEMDVETRREGYTEAEIRDMFASFEEKFGAVGDRVQKGLIAYTEGFNAYLSELRQQPDECPAEYGATQNPCPFPFPEDWSVSDTLFLVVLQLRVFGETAGGELDNAALYAHLTKKHGDEEGTAMFEDFLRRNDPRSATTIPRSEAIFPSQDLGATKQASIAIPDNAEELAREQAAAASQRQRFLEAMGFKAPASNALLVSGKESATGNPLQIGAPQVGYAVPSFFMDVDVHAPGVDFRGPAVPAASALIPLGRGRDYAWSLTTGYSDAVDVRVEKLCNPEGGEVSEESEHYTFRGECREMTSREETFVVKPSAASPGQPDMETRTFYRTVHGPVFARAKVDGQPVALVKQRFFWKRELDSVPQFYKWNVMIDSIDDFRRAAKGFTMSFNALYADAKDIGYFHVGYYPKRSKGVHPALPVWGTGRWEWQGRLPFRRHPKVVNPEQGWLAQWNNKPARGWGNMDGAKWGPIHRVQLLQDRMTETVAGRRKATLSDLVDVIRDAATRDTRGTYLAPKMLRWVGNRAEKGSDEAAAAELVASWIDDDSHIFDKDGDEQMDAGAAFSIFDEWYRQTVSKVFDDEIGEDAYDLVPAPVFGQSMWFDFSSYLKNTFDRRARRALARNYCDDITTDERETCPDVVLAALTDALAALKEDQGDDMSAWAADAWYISFQQLGAGSVDDIPWQNRGTHNHVVEVLSDAGPVNIPEPEPTPSPTETP